MDKNNYNNCKIVTWNCQGTLKIDQMKSFIRQQQPQILAILEARRIDKPNAKLEPTGCTVVQTEGNNPIIAFIKKDVTYQKTDVQLEEKNERASNILNIRINHNGNIRHISIVYAHPRSRHKTVEDCLDRSKPKSGSWLIMGSQRQKQ